MEWPKLKNIVILILLLANLFLLVMVVTQEHGAVQYQEQALTNTISVLERNGIQIDRGQIPSELELSPMTVEREQESEDDLAAALLGSCSVSDLGSGRYAYQSARGSAEFRSNGSFWFTFADGVQSVEADGGEESHAVATLEAIGFDGTVIAREDAGGRVTLTLYQIWQDVPVYSCQAVLEYENGCLRSIVGQRLMGTPQASSDRSELISVPTALLRVLSGINDLGDICNEITSMEPGYLLTTTAETTRLIPIWYVTTDTGAYSLNALTGALERA